ncbi:MAG: hypothetical protein RBU25_09740 [Lentisphaeria bacterium]|jgi:predicted  nucleic acid-binding Zn-ribbon protein|nr:hypothetical protein [Lentisphaeria bacterium]
MVCITGKNGCRLAFVVAMYVFLAMAGAGEIDKGWTRQQVIGKLGAPGFVVGSEERETLGYGARRIVLENGLVVDPGEPDEAEGGNVAPESAPAAGRLSEWDMKIQRERDKIAVLEVKRQALAKDVRSAEQAVFRIKNQSIGLPPRLPNTRKGRIWEQYLKDEAAYKAAAEKKESELKQATDNLEKLAGELLQVQEEIARVEGQIRELAARGGQEVAAKAPAGNLLSATVEKFKETVGAQKPEPESLPDEVEQESAEEDKAGLIPVGWLIGSGVALVVLLIFGFMHRMQRG